MEMLFGDCTFVPNSPLMRPEKASTRGWRVVGVPAFAICATGDGRAREPRRVA